MNGHDDRIHWEIANIHGIKLQADAWHAGRCNDVVQLSPDSYLIATDSGGVWYGSLVGSGGNNLPLTDSWDNPNVRCLATDRNLRFLAGCGGSGALFESSPGNASFWFPIQLPAGTESVNRVRIARTLPRIVIACDRGIFWSPLPAPNAGQGYTFKPALGVPAETYSDIVFGPGDRVVIAKWGSESSRPGVPSRAGGIFLLDWVGADLMLTGSAALPSDVDPKHMGRTSLAVCESRLDRLYAISADPRITSKTFQQLRVI